MHTDEAILATKFGTLWTEGTFDYDPSDYHGPGLHQVSWLYAKLARWGSPDEWTEAQLRHIPYCSRILVLGMTLLFARPLTWHGSTVAMLLIAVSPMQVFYSRYYIMEMLLVLLLLIALWALLEICPDRRKRLAGSAGGQSGFRPCHQRDLCDQCLRGCVRLRSRKSHRWRLHSSRRVTACGWTIRVATVIDQRLAVVDWRSSSRFCGQLFRLHYGSQRRQRKRNHIHGLTPAPLRGRGTLSALVLRPDHAFLPQRRRRYYLVRGSDRCARYRRHHRRAPQSGSGWKARLFHGLPSCLHGRFCTLFIPSSATKPPGRFCPHNTPSR